MSAAVSVFITTSPCSFACVKYVNHSYRLLSQRQQTLHVLTVLPLLSHVHTRHVALSERQVRLPDVPVQGIQLVARVVLIVPLHHELLAMPLRLHLLLHRTQVLPAQTLIQRSFVFSLSTRRNGKRYPLLQLGILLLLPLLLRILPLLPPLCLLLQSTLATELMSATQCLTLLLLASIHSIAPTLSSFSLFSSSSFFSFSRCTFDM